MSSTTVTLERSAYELLRAHKRPDESFSEEVRRLLSGSGPSLRELTDILGGDNRDRIVNAIEEVRRVDLEQQQQRLRTSRRRRGSGA